MSLRIVERPTADAIVVDLHGRITAADTTIRETIQSLIARGVRYVVLNFADVSYMDSVGLSALVRSHLALRQHDGRLVLLHVPRQIAALFVATHLTAIFEMFDDEAVAIGHASGDCQAASSPESTA